MCACICVSPGSDDTQMNGGSSVGLGTAIEARLGCWGCIERSGGDSKTDFHTVDSYVSHILVLKDLFSSSLPKPSSIFTFGEEQQDVGDGHRDLRNSAKWKKSKKQGEMI